MNYVKTKHVCLCVFTLSTCPYNSHISLLFEVIIVPDKTAWECFVLLFFLWSKASHPSAMIPDLNFCSLVKAELKEFVNNRLNR